MHKVPESWTAAAPNSVEITFQTLDELDWEPATSVAVAGADLRGPYPDERLQTWRLDEDDVKVAIIDRSFPDTDPALVAEAEAVVESIRFERTYAGVPRLVFRLFQGWDSG